MLVAEAERAIAKANPPEQGKRTDLDIVIPDHEVSKDVVRQIRSVHSKLSDEEFEERIGTARANQEPITRRALAPLRAPKPQDRETPAPARSADPPTGDPDPATDPPESAPEAPDDAPPAPEPPAQSEEPPPADAAQPDEDAAPGPLAEIRRALDILRAADPVDDLPYLCADELAECISLAVDLGQFGRSMAAHASAELESRRKPGEEGQAQESVSRDWVGDDFPDIPEFLDRTGRSEGGDA